MSVTFQLLAQFPGAAGTSGSTAIYKDSSVFIDWASHAKIIRGYQNISNPSAGYATVGDSISVTQKAGLNGVVSLGDGGIAILTFSNPIVNGTGFDFAVFENSFNDFFLELAFVEASSDGVHYFRFPSQSLTDTSTQKSSFDLLNPTQLNNLAGKYRGDYGTPFDLSELPDTILLDKNTIQFIKVIDVVGALQAPFYYRDSEGRKINDPFPTEFPSGGFDLDAVGVIHNTLNTSINQYQAAQSLVMVYPNPAKHTIYIKSETDIKSVELYDSFLNKQAINFLENNSLNISELANGIYFIKILFKENYTLKKIIKE